MNYNIMMGMNINRKVGKKQFQDEYRNIRLYVQKKFN